MLTEPLAHSTAMLENCGDMLLWRAGCFTYVVHFRPHVKSFNLWVYLEKKNKNHSFSCASYWGLKGIVLSQALTRLGGEMCILAAQVSVSGCSGCKAELRISPPEFDVYLL